MCSNVLIILEGDFEQQNKGVGGCQFKNLEFLQLDLFSKKTIKMIIYLLFCDKIVIS